MYIWMMYLQVNICRITDPGTQVNSNVASFFVVTCYRRVKSRGERGREGGRGSGYPRCVYLLRMSADKDVGGQLEDRTITGCGESVKTSHISEEFTSYCNNGVATCYMKGRGLPSSV